MRDKRWVRTLLHLVKASDRGRVSAHAVADQFAKLNYQVHLNTGSVGPRCIVAWRHKKKGVHKSGGGNQYYTGTKRDNSSPGLPLISMGTDFSAVLEVLMPHFKEMFEDARTGGPAKELDRQKLNADLAHLPDKPDERLGRDSPKIAIQLHRVRGSTDYYKVAGFSFALPVYFLAAGRRPDSAGNPTEISDPLTIGDDHWIMVFTEGNFAQRALDVLVREKRLTVEYGLIARVDTPEKLIETMQQAKARGLEFVTFDPQPSYEPPNDQGHARDRLRPPMAIKDMIAALAGTHP